MKINPGIVTYITLAAFAALGLAMVKTGPTDIIFSVTLFSLATVMALVSYAKPESAIGTINTILNRMAGLSLSIAVIGILFRLKFFHGWQTMFWIGIITFMVVVLFFFANISRIREKYPDFISMARKYYALPALFVVVGAIVCLGFPEKSIYNTFTTLSKNTPYEQFISAQDTLKNK